MKLYLSPPTGFPPQLNGEKYILPSQIGKTLDTKCASESKKNKKIPERPHELEVSLHSRPDILVPDFLNVQCGPKSQSTTNHLRFRATNLHKFRYFLQALLPTLETFRRSV